MNPSPDTIRATRLAANLTQRGAAALLGVHWRTFQCWELGDHPMREILYEVLVAKIAASSHSSLLP